MTTFDLITESPERLARAISALSPRISYDAVLSALNREADVGEPHPAKHDTGKPRLSLVPPGIIEAIARVREYGVNKYKDPDNWRLVEPERYVDAMMRHIWDYLRDPKGIDGDSGMPHLWHVACNVAFLTELERSDRDESSPSDQGN